MSGWLHNIAIFYSLIDFSLLVGDWPYQFQYKSASIEELAPTHRKQYMMVRKGKDYYIF